MKWHPANEFEVVVVWKRTTYTNGTFKMRKAKCSTPGALAQARLDGRSRRSNNFEVKAECGRKRPLA